jgi:hypothetical protein
MGVSLYPSCLAQAAGRTGTGYKVGRQAQAGTCLDLLPNRLRRRVLDLVVHVHFETDRTPLHVRVHDLVHHGHVFEAPALRLAHGCVRVCVCVCVCVRKRGNTGHVAASNPAAKPAKPSPCAWPGLYRRALLPRGPSAAERPQCPAPSRQEEEQRNNVHTPPKVVSGRYNRPPDEFFTEVSKTAMTTDPHWSSCDRGMRPAAPLHEGPSPASFPRDCPLTIPVPLVLHMGLKS